MILCEAVCERGPMEAGQSFVVQGETSPGTSFRPSENGRRRIPQCQAIHKASMDSFPGYLYMVV